MSLPLIAPTARHGGPVAGAVLTDCFTKRTRPATRLLGILPGEGIGPEVIHSALLQLDALESISPMAIERRIGGPIGHSAKGAHEGQITPDSEAFFQNIFDAGGTLLCGPGGGRFVYDLRKRFDLFCKLAPIKPSPALSLATRFKPEVISRIDILVVRDNAGGLYQGQWQTRHDPTHGRIAEHAFSYSEPQVQRIVDAGAALARLRRHRMHVILKDGGVPAISNLWRDIAQSAAKRANIACHFLNADHAAYQLIQYPREFDVIVTPNMVGDILADLAAVFLGSRGLSYSGNFSADGCAVYQTGHGAAYDLAGTDRANPVAQILSLAMLLRESFGLPTHATAIEHAVDQVWRQGWRTDDLCEPGTTTIGTREMAQRIADQITQMSLQDTALAEGSAS